MDYCTKWRIVGLVIGLTPFVLALLVGTAIAQRASTYWRGVIGVSLVVIAILVTTVPASLVLWNGLRPSFCDRKI
jgi:hypothetical protein